MAKRLNKKKTKEEKKEQEVLVKDEWVKPTLEDVSGKIMAQPYIRFT